MDGGMTLQDMQDMRDCYDTLLSAAAATASSAYGRVHQIIHSCLLFYDDELMIYYYRILRVLAGHGLLSSSEDCFK